MPSRDVALPGCAGACDAPFAAGGAADTIARIVTPALSDAVHQTIFVENKAGAGGSIGSAAVRPDGYTSLVNLGPPHQTVQLFTKGLGYDPVKDFTPICVIASAPQAPVVPASSPIKNWTPFVAAAHGAKGLSCGTSGIGTSQHPAGLLLASHKESNWSI